ncbi:NAD(P)-binding protein [Plenodomus tracheiphilus IPT5]|uniref:NAD(P)-binding protein n=1 Tax=Plenodomus tracheiphilus IPT5 TaxID=1408161 RepID=A0A6A7B1I6_9PLEO|nr:NAD(P)-binding protein [Plenodomus tracheiphilus IPT5]
MSVPKVALITASSAGLGAQIARAFAPDFRVVINYSSNSERANALIKELSSIPGSSSEANPRFHLIQGDMSSKTSVQSLVKETIEKMGRLDVVVSNAGWTRMTTFTDIEQQVNDEDWDKCFTMNVKTHLWLAYAAKDALAETEGTFISTASVAGVKPSGSSVPYAVTKAAQIHLMKSLAVILAPKIRVNSISPGMLLTEWGLKFPEAKRNAAINNTKLKRLAVVEDVADQVRTLALSKSITGQNISIDGGSSLCVLHAMALRVGQVLRGAKGSYELLQSLKDSTVFKARVLSSASPSSQWAMVKSAASADEKKCLRREYRNHGCHEIASSRHIRAMWDTVCLEGDLADPSCLVFEWMDQDLRSVTDRRFRSDPKLPKAVSKAVLSALEVLRGLNAIHTDINPNNIFLSDIDGPSPIVKVGDLGNAIKDSSTTQRIQSLPCRAPEVWQGLPCRHASDIWSLGVTLTTKLAPLMLFGEMDKRIDGQVEAWCIAKIMRLAGPIKHPTDSVYQQEFELAEQLEIMDHPLGHIKLITRDHWREELEDIPDPPVSSDLLDFIETLLVIDPNRRPTAVQALMHPYLKPSLEDSKIYQGFVHGDYGLLDVNEPWIEVGFTENHEMTMEVHEVTA